MKNTKAITMGLLEEMLLSYGYPLEEIKNPSKPTEYSVSNKPVEYWEPNKFYSTISE